MPARLLGRRWLGCRLQAIGYQYLRGLQRRPCAGEDRATALVVDRPEVGRRSPGLTVCRGAGVLNALGEEHP